MGRVRDRVEGTPRSLCRLRVVISYRASRPGPA